MREKIYDKFKLFSEQSDPDKIRTIWTNQSKAFIDFWNNKIMDDSYQSLTDSEIDEVILILDKNAKGSRKNTHAVAKPMIPQGVWRRLFNEIKEDSKLKNLMNRLFNSDSDEEKIKIIDEIYVLNEGRKNSLTGKNGNAINCMLFAYSPTKHLAMVSLKDRRKFIEYYNFENSIDFDADSQGKKMINTNHCIIERFKSFGTPTTPRIISEFVYGSLKDEWKNSEDSLETTHTEKEQEEYSGDKASFYMEKELENFLIANWGKTKFSEDYELIEENGDLVSQQYRTDIGIIDILVQDKKTKQLVVIELKRDQTSDDTIGQTLRYMGWLESHKTNGNPVKGIIIAVNYDKRLYYALKKTKDIRVFSYKIDFSLSELQEQYITK